MDQLLVVAVIGLAGLALALRRRLPARAVDRRFDAEARPA
jgi:hypothetical protein